MAWSPSVSRTRPNARNAEESMPCALSNKIQPDSRGLVPAIHVFVVTRDEGVDARDEPGHDESAIRTPIIDPIIARPQARVAQAAQHQIAHRRGRPTKMIDGVVAARG